MAEGAEHKASLIDKKGIEKNGYIFPKLLSFLKTLNLTGELMKKCTKYFILLIVGTLLYCAFFLPSISYKFDNTPLQISPLAKNFLERDLKKGLVIGRTSFEG